MPTTSNMSLVLPAVSATLGPLWASELNTALSLVDTHDHSSGKGVKVTPAGLNINSDLAFNSNDLTTVRTVMFDAQSATLADIRAIYSVNGDLYWNNGSGTAVQITSGASVQSSASTIARAFERLAVSGNKTILAADTYSYLDTNTGSSIIYTLPAANAVAAGRFYEFKDSTGQAATNNITINRAGADTIDGATSLVISKNYGVTRLVSDGTSKWMTADPLTGFIQVVPFTANGTYTKNKAARYIRVVCVGAGGGGGGADGAGASSGSGGGGGGGATAIKTILNSLVGATETVTIGVGGTGGSNVGGNGTNGTASSFGILCVGGAGNQGLGMTSQNDAMAQGGAQGLVAACTGDIIIPGSPGMCGIVSGSTPIAANGGGSSHGGGGRAFATTSGSAQAGGAPDANTGGGGGGGVCWKTGSGVTGGNGASGYVYVEEYY